MKASFKKLTLLVFHRERHRVIEMLQDLGVLHIDYENDPQSEDIASLEQERNKLNKVIEIIEEQHSDDSDKKKSANHSIKGIIENVLKLKHRLEANLLEKESLLKEKLQRIPWNDLDLAKIERLREQGLNVNFYVAHKKEFDAYDFSSLICEVVHRSSDQVYFVIISKAQEQLPFETVTVPEQTLSELIQAEEHLITEYEQIQSDIAKYANHLTELKVHLKTLENKLTLLKAQAGFNEHKTGKILSLKGWFPIEVESDLINSLNNEQLSFSIDEPQPGDDVPVKLKNKSYSKLFEPITRIFELPNYYEWDPTPLIAVFYPIMFAYCLGDAGYGIIFFLAALTGFFTFLKQSKNLALLGMVLGLTTTIMGLVKSGSIFGIPTNSDQWEIFQMLGDYVLIPDDRNFIFNAFNVALIIGVVQIFLGIFVSIYNKLRYDHYSTAIWQVGKLFIVTGLIWIFLADMQEVESLQILGISRQVLLIVGVLLVLFFHDMKQSLGARAASGFLPLFFIFTGVLGDVLSYVRLFALGVASSVLGLVVNQIGMQIMGDQWWGILIGVVFLLFGHTLNFCIAVLGSFVHPLRLTFVEFYNNAQFKGGGKIYRPLKKQNIES